jgi:hypothetical protein
MKYALRAGLLLVLTSGWLAFTGEAEAGRWVWKFQGVHSGWVYEPDESDYSYPSAPAPAPAPQPGGAVITSAADGRALDAVGGGDKVTVWPMHGAANQRWRLVPAGDGTVFIECAADGRVLDVAMGGTRVIRWPRHGGTKQRWRLVPTGDGHQYIESALDGRVLYVSPQNHLFTWHKKGTPDQKWSVHY